MSKDKNPPKNWVEKISTPKKSPNENNNKGKGRSLGEIKPASTSKPATKNTDELNLAALKKGKEAQGKKWTEKEKLQKTVGKGVSRLKEAAGKTSIPSPQKSEASKKVKSPAKKQEGKPLEKVTTKTSVKPENATPKNKGVLKVKTSLQKKAPNTPKKAPTKKPPTKGR